MQSRTLTGHGVVEEKLVFLMGTVREWIERVYKPCRLELDDEIIGYKEFVIRSHEKRLESTGLTVISRHDSCTGKAEWFGRDWAPEQRGVR